MAYPTPSKLHDALLAFIGQSPEGRTKRPQACAALGKYFQLSPAELSETHKTGANIWGTTVAFARQHLVDAGLVSNAEWGIWAITDEGRRALNGIAAKPVFEPSSTVSEPETPAEREEDAAVESEVTRSEIESIRKALSQVATTAALQTEIRRLTGVIGELNARLSETEKNVTLVSPESFKIQIERLEEVRVPSLIAAAFQNHAVETREKEERDRTRTYTLIGLTATIVGLLMGAIQFILPLLHK